MCVYRDPEVVQIFDVIEHGRRFYRSLVWTSDSNWCLHSLPPQLAVYGGETFQPAGNHYTSPKPARSLCITRVLQGKTQTFIPDRLLYGMVPTTILEDYNFWQNEDDSMSGYYKPDFQYDPTKKSYMITIKLFKVAHHGVAFYVSAFSLTRAFHSPESEGHVTHRRVGLRL